MRSQWCVDDDEMTSLSLRPVYVRKLSVDMLGVDMRGFRVVAARNVARVRVAHGRSHGAYVRRLERLRGAQAS